MADDKVVFLSRAAEEAARLSSNAELPVLDPEAVQRIRSALTRSLEDLDQGNIDGLMLIQTMRTGEISWGCWEFGETELLASLERIKHFILSGGH